VLVFAYFTSGTNSLQRKFTEPFVGLQIERLFFSTLSLVDEPSKILTYLIVNEKPVGVETAERAIMCRGIWNMSPLECDLKQEIILSVLGDCTNTCDTSFIRDIWKWTEFYSDRMLSVRARWSLVSSILSRFIFFRLYQMPPGISRRFRYLMVHINRPVQRLFASLVES